MTDDLACAQCGEPVAVTADVTGRPFFTHVTDPADGHRAELPPVVVTYRKAGLWHEAHCDELGGLLVSSMDPGTPRAVAAGLLRRMSPPRNVREVTEGYGDEPAR